MLTQEQINDIELKLTAQVPIEVGNLKMYAPTIREIVEIGEVKHNQIVSYLLLNKDNLKDVEDNDYDIFQFVCLYYYYDPDFKILFDQGIKLFFKKGAHFSESNGDVFFYLGNRHEEKIIDKDNFPVIQDVLKVMNKISFDPEPEYKPANEAAQKIIEMIKRNKAKQPKKKETINLQSIISGVAWKSNNINIMQIFDLNYFQLIDGFNRLDNIDNYNHILTGIYTGNIDSKSIKMPEINWAKILNQ